MDIIPIAQIEQRTAHALSKSIRAVVTLIWPYSSSTRQAALLLAEPDFRLRKSKGQVRVQLAGAAAEAIAKSKISSGDEVVLSLEGARWVEAAAASISTPGRSVDVELAYRRRIVCELRRNGALLKQLDVNDQTRSEPRSRSTSPGTPYKRPRLVATPQHGRVNGLSTPASSAFHRRARVVSGELVDSPYDPFANDIKAVGHDRKRQRMSWGSDARWTINDNIPSPSKRQARDDWVRAEDLQSPTKTPDPFTPTTPSPEDVPSPSKSRVANGETHTGTERYAQELVDLVGGDMEEEDFTEIAQTEVADRDKDDEHAQAVKNAFSGPNIFGGTKFSVFRDTAPTSFFGPPQDAERSSNTETKRTNQESQLELDEQQFFDLPLSEPASEDADQEPTTTEVLQSQPQQESHLLNDGEGEDDDHASALEMDTTPNAARSRSPQSTPRLHIKDMPPPALTALQTTNFDAAYSTSMPPPPASALSRSPKTPDIRPQHSAALPLPSPYPGEELSSYVDFSPPSLQSGRFVPPSAGSSPVLPDWMLQIGFGFGSQGFLRESPPKHVPEDPSTDEMQSLPVAQNIGADDGDMERAGTLLELDHVEIGGDDAESPTVPTRSKKYNREGHGNTSSEDAVQHDLGISVPMRLSALPRDMIRPLVGSTTTHAIELSSDSSDDVEDDQEAPTRGSDVQLAQWTAGKSAGTDENEVEVRDPLNDQGNHSVDSHKPEIGSPEEWRDIEAGSEDREAEALDEDDAGSDALFRRNEGRSTPSIKEHAASSDLSFPIHHAELSPEVAAASIRDSTHFLRPEESLSIRNPVVVDLIESDDETDAMTGETPREQSSAEETSTTGQKSFPGGSSSPIQPSIRPGLPKTGSAIQEEVTSSPQPETFEVPDVGSLYEPSMPARTVVGFAPRVTRRRAALHAESANDIGPLTSAPPAHSQQHLHPPRLRVQDTLEGIAHSDGSLTTAPPSRGSEGSVLHPIGEDEALDESSTPLPAPSPPHAQGPVSFDGADDEDVPFIASSPPLAPVDALGEVAYPALPFTEFDTVQSHLDRLDTAREMGQDGRSMLTPEASQLLSQSAIEPSNDVPHVPQLPPTPHQTQIEQSFDDAIAGDQNQGMDETMPRVSRQETPIKALSKLSSDPVSSVLSPSFDIGSSRNSGELLPKEDPDLQAGTHNVTKQDTAALKIDDGFSDLEVTAGVALAKTSQSGTRGMKDHVAIQDSVNSEMVIDDFSFTQSQATQVRGLLTSISYYTPLSALFSCIRMPVSNSQSYNDGCVDVIAVVTKASTKPLRADKGQRDFYTTLSITDEFFYPKSLRVQVFRPWRAALPKADKGDAILLRGFEVFSAKGNVGVGLKSAESAAWCVWRGRGEKSDANDGDGERPWTYREVVGEEDMRGPPVELGDQERQYARELKAWYQDVAGEETSGPAVSSLQI